MSEFVNYSTRNVSLPDGCKGLIEVLRKEKSSKPIAFGLSPNKDKVTRGGSEVGSLADVGRFIVRLFQTSAPEQFFMTFLECERVTVSVFRVPDQGLKASIWFPDNSDMVRVMRTFFERWGLKVPAEGSLPLMFATGMKRTWDISPMPSTASELTELLSSALKQFERPGENLSARFLFYEVTP
jgi:hypothetical protein